MEQRLDISWEGILKVFIAGFLFYVLFLARHIVVWFFFALIIALLLEPAINFLRRLRLPKMLAVGLVYASILGIFGLILYLASPIFIYEINQFAKNIPDYFVKLNPILRGLGIDIAQNFKELNANLIAGLQDSSQSIIRAVSVFFGGVSSTLAIFIFSFYISLEEKGVEKFLVLVSPKKYEEYILTIFEKAQYKVAGWFGARIMACVFVGIASFLIFFFFNIKYAFTLSLISGVLNFVPFIGPLATGLLVMVFVGISDSWIVAIYIAVALAVIQQLENNIVTPLLMKKLLNLPPILVLLSILVGGAIFGFLGVIFIVPVFGILYEFLKEFLEKKRAEGYDVSSEPMAGNY